MSNNNTNQNSVVTTVAVQTVELERCVRLGRYYYPAVKHYYPGSIVQCDRCLRTNLRSCIGHQEIDICLSCAQHIEMNMKYPNPPPISHNLR